MSLTERPALMAEVIQRVVTFSREKAGPKCIPASVSRRWMAAMMSRVMRGSRCLPCPSGKIYFDRGLAGSASRISVICGRSRMRSPWRRLMTPARVARGS